MPRKDTMRTLVFIRENKMLRKLSWGDKITFAERWRLWFILICLLVSHITQIPMNGFSLKRQGRPDSAQGTIWNVLVCFGSSCGYMKFYFIWGRGGGWEWVVEAVGGIGFGGCVSASKTMEMCMKKACNLKDAVFFKTSENPSCPFWLMQCDASPCLVWSCIALCVPTKPLLHMLSCC